ncbi:Zinc finger protein MAGPIE [Dendrobium catenatum]|uniref:Protein EARLY HEADING DATE 2 n=1 Tax=Dendrobium catenatum TaxID=906689 RepID=A0A2I0WWA2_9ASPA|nr:Zinc finger protein MAGPIE [Dendrobium catenatum]
MSNTSEEEESKYLVTGMAVMSGNNSAIASATKKRRNPPGNPDPDAEVIALSPRTLIATNRYICEVCHKGFQRDQNLQLHRRGHNLPWKLKQRSSNEVKKKVYVCPEIACAHHDPTRALGDLTGIKKHFSRKHGDKKWKCDKCSKRYAVQSDWKAHSKICGTKEYRCDCGTIFSRKDSFVTHRAFCDALTEENYRTNHGLATMAGNLYSQSHNIFSRTMQCQGSSINANTTNISGSDQNSNNALKSLSHNHSVLANSDILFNDGNLGISNVQFSGGSRSLSMSMGSSFMSATALLQNTTDMGTKAGDESISPMILRGFTGFPSNTRPSGSLQDTINRYNSNNALLCLDTAEVSSYEGIQSSLQMSSKASGGNASGFREASFVQFPVAGERKISSVHRRDAGEETGDRRKGRMTKDFLGLGASGSASVSSSGNTNYFDNEFYPYQQMSFEKHTWQ